MTRDDKTLNKGIKYEKVLMFMICEKQILCDEQGNKQK